MKTVRRLRVCRPRLQRRRNSNNSRGNDLGASPNGFSWSVSRRSRFPVRYGPRRNLTVRTSVTKTIAYWLAVVVALAVIGCSGQPLSTREKGTGIGALIGAGTGAIIGAAVGSPGAGAAIGGALGAGGGFLVGNEMQNQEATQHQTQSQINEQQRAIEQQRRQIEQLKQQQQTE